MGEHKKKENVFLFIPTQRRGNSLTCRESGNLGATVGNVLGYFSEILFDCLLWLFEWKVQIYFNRSHNCRTLPRDQKSWLKLSASTASNNNLPRPIKNYRPCFLPSNVDVCFGPRFSFSTFSTLHLPALFPAIFYPQVWKLINRKKGENEGNFWKRRWKNHGSLVDGKNKMNKMFSSGI